MPRAAELPLHYFRCQLSQPETECNFECTRQRSELLAKPVAGYKPPDWFLRLEAECNSVYTRQQSEEPEAQEERSLALVVAVELQQQQEQELNCC